MVNGSVCISCVWADAGAYAMKRIGLLFAMQMVNDLRVEYRAHSWHSRDAWGILKSRGPKLLRTLLKLDALSCQDRHTLGGDVLSSGQEVEWSLS